MTRNELPDTKINHQLRRVFNFTESDLQANRTGKLTSRQRQRLEDNLFAFWKVGGLTIVVLLISLVLGIMGILFNPDPVLDVAYIPVALLLIIVGAIITTILWARHRYQIYAAIRAGHVTTLAGRLKIIKPDSSLNDEVNRVGRFQVKAFTFNDLSPEQYEVMSQIDTMYTHPKVVIHHVPNHYVVLSLEISPKARNVQ